MEYQQLKAEGIEHLITSINNLNLGTFYQSHKNILFIDMKQAILHYA